MFDSCFVMQYLVPFLVLQSRKLVVLPLLSSWCLLAVLVFCGSFSWCRGLVCSNGVARKLKRLITPNGDYRNKQCFSSITVLFKMGTSLKGKNLLPVGANSFF